MVTTCLLLLLLSLSLLLSPAGGLARPLSPRSPFAGTGRVSSNRNRRATSATSTALHIIKPQPNDNPPASSPQFPLPVPSPPSPPPAPSLTPLTPLQTKVHALVNSPRFELFSGFLVLLTSGFYAYGTITSINPLLGDVLREAESAIAIFFAVEYGLQLYSSANRRKFIFTPLSLVDLLTFVPTILILIAPSTIATTLISYGGLTSLEVFSSLRLLRVVRLQRFVADFESFRKVEIALGIEEGVVKIEQLQVRVG